MLKRILVITCICLAMLGCSDDEDKSAKKQDVFDVYLEPIGRTELLDQQAHQQKQHEKKQTEQQTQQ